MTALIAHQIRYETLAYWRDRRRAVMTVIFPVLMLVLLGSLQRDHHLLASLVPGIVAYGVVTTTFSNLSVSLAAAREQEIIKRIQGTPLPWWGFLAGRIGAALIATAGMTVVALGLGAALYGITVPAHRLPGFLGIEALGAVVFTTLGIAISRLLPTADSAGPVQAVVVFPVAFISGVWFPMDDAPHLLDVISKSLPLRPLADGLRDGPTGHELLTLVIWTAIGARLMMGFLRSVSARD